MKILFYGTRDYDQIFFDRLKPEYPDIEFTFLESNLYKETASLAAGYDGICAFVNADLGAEVIEELRHQGIRLILMRCAGYNNVDLNKNCRMWHKSSSCSRIFPRGSCRTRYGAGTYRKSSYP